MIEKPKPVFEFCDGDCEDEDYFFTLNIKAHVKPENKDENKEKDENNQEK